VPFGLSTGRAEVDKKNPHTKKTPPFPKCLLMDLDVNVRMPKGMVSGISWQSWKIMIKLSL